MAADASPTGPAPESQPEEDESEFEFDPADELEPANALVDVVLTRAGEFTLDLIEAVQEHPVLAASLVAIGLDRKSTRLNSSHVSISYAVFCLKKKKKKNRNI